MRSKFISYLISHKWGLGGFVFIVIMGLILWDFTDWRLGDIIAILAVLCSLYVMLYNGHRTDIRFQKLIDESDKNTLRRIIGPERRKELMIFAEDLEILYARRQGEKIPIELIEEELKNSEDINDEFLEGFLGFLGYSSKNIKIHNLSASLKMLIFNDFMDIDQNMEGPMTPDKRKAALDLAIRIYGETVRELHDFEKEFKYQEP